MTDQTPKEEEKQEEEKKELPVIETPPAEPPKEETPAPAEDEEASKQEEKDIEGLKRKKQILEKEVADLRVQRRGLKEPPAPLPESTPKDKDPEEVDETWARVAKVADQVAERKMHERMQKEAIDLAVDKFPEIADMDAWKAMTKFNNPNHGEGSVKSFLSNIEDAITIAKKRGYLPEDAPPSKPSHPQTEKNNLRAAGGGAVAGVKKGDTPKLSTVEQEVYDKLAARDPNMTVEKYLANK